MASYLTPLPADAWDERYARHLLHRAGFGVDLGRVGELTALGVESAVEFYLNCDKIPDNSEPADFLIPKEQIEEWRTGLRETKDQEEKAKLRQTINRRERRAVQSLKEWWLRQMLLTSRPLEQKMALFWHGHFATSAQKVNPSRANYQIIDIFRGHGLGNFQSLVTEVGKSAAMLIYLDNRLNRKGRANENWARELMELFTLGIGNYTEKDIKEAARAFTGWTINQTGFVFRTNLHDDGKKTFLGETGRFKGEDIISIIFKQPAVAEFISCKIWEYLVYANPDEALVKELAGVFRESGYEIKELLRAIFRSKEFYSERALLTQIKSPVQLMVGMIDQLDVTLKNWNSITLILRILGQDLLMPPNVKGWEGNRAWISTNNLLIRYNISAAMINGEDLRKKPKVDADATMMEDTMDEMAMEEMMDSMKEEIENAAKNLNNRSFKNSPFKAAAFIEPYQGKKAGDVVHSLSDTLLGKRLDEKQHALLVRSLVPEGDAETEVSRKTVNELGIRATVHLLMSTAEYQLC